MPAPLTDFANAFDHRGIEFAVGTASLAKVLSLGSPLAPVEKQHVQSRPCDETQEQQQRQEQYAADYQY